MSFYFRSQAARTVLHSAEPVAQMLNDWKQLDFEGIARQAMWTFSQSVEEDYELVYEREFRTKPVWLVLLFLFLIFSLSFGHEIWLSLLSISDYKEFTQLLDQQATIDQYAEWASNLVNRCVLKVSIVDIKSLHVTGPGRSSQFV